MVLYLIRRIVQAIFFIFLASLLVYTVLIDIYPRGPHALYQSSLELGVRRYDLEKIFKVDKPWPVGFLAWMFDPSNTTITNEHGEVVPVGLDIKIGTLHIQGSGALTGNFGTAGADLNQQRAIIDLIGDRWLNTVLLVGSGLILAILLALPLGVLAAVYHRSRLDHAITFFSFIGLSVPPFVLGLFFIMALAVLPWQLHSQLHWDWMPYLAPGGVADTDQSNNPVNRLYHLVLPALTLGLVQAVWLSRQLRTSMLEVMGQDYIRTAWSKGLSRRRVIFKHALRNALLPVITMIGLALPALASGAIIIEMIFNYQGLGQLTFKAFGGSLFVFSSAAITDGLGSIEPRPPDPAISLAMTFIFIILVAFSNILADFMYTVADPRIHLGSEKA